MPDTTQPPGGGAQPDQVGGRAVEAAFGIGGAGLCLIAAAITTAGNDSELAWLEGLARAVLVGAPIAVGLYAWRRPPFHRFGALLVATGVVAFVATLSESSDPTAYVIGRFGGWAIEPLLIYLILAFPTGRLQSRVDRWIVTVLVLDVLILFVPTVLVVSQFPLPFPWTLCHGGCPENPLMVTSSEPAVVDDLIRPVRELIMVGVSVAVAALVAGRLRNASHLTRRALGPVLAVALVRAVSFAGLVVIRAQDADSQLLDAGVWVLALCVPLLAGAFMLGIARWRLYIASAIQRLAAGLSSHPEPDELRAALATAFEDPSLEIVYQLDDAPGWVTADGARFEPPASGSGRWLTEIHDGPRVVAGIVHDEALSDERAFLDAATSYAMMTLDNHRLAAEAAVLLAEVQDSRARIQATADDERRRIERDLHDGAQQRLVALRIKLELEAERIGGPSAELIRRLGTEVDSTLDEVRALARGIYPSPLADRGLVEALRSAAMQAPLPTVVLAEGVQPRYPREIESAVYFCCLEALQNAGKHAGSASAVAIDLTDNGELRFEIRDDGDGFDPASAGSGIGLTSMRDRVAAVGGELAVASSPGRGTRVIGRIPRNKADRSVPRGLRFRGAASPSPRRPRG
jgi:signal transduction histidine kinase